MNITTNRRTGTARAFRDCSRTSRRAQTPSLCEPLEPRRLLANAFEFFAGRVVVEAEQYDSRTTASGHSWQLVAGGVDRAMKALPDNGANINQNIASTSPRLDYQINFPYAGEFMIFIRGQAVAANVGTSDSLHVGVDGVVQGGVDRFNGFGSSFGWQSETMDLPGVDFETRINIATPGVHTVNLYMREDGLTVDRFFISGGSGSIYPFGPGPRASERLSTGDPPSADLVGLFPNPSPLAGPAELVLGAGENLGIKSILPLPDGRFYLFHQRDGLDATVTLHLSDGAIDRGFGEWGGVDLLFGGPLVTGRPMPQPGGGILVWVAGESGSPNRIYRYNQELDQDGSYGGGDGFIETSETFAIAPDGGVVEFRHLSPDMVRWTRYNRSGGVVLQVDRPAPHIDAIAPQRQPYTATDSDTFEAMEALPDGSVLVELRGLNYHGLRKFNADFTPNATWAGDGTLDLSRYDADSFLEMIVAGPDGRLVLSERDTDGEHYMHLLTAAGSGTAFVNYFFTEHFGFSSRAENQSVRFHSDGDVSIAYTIRGEVRSAIIENWPDGFGVDRFNSDGTRDSAFSPIRVDVGNFFDETLRGADTALLADGTFIIAATAGSDALVWRAKTGPLLAPYNESGGFLQVQAEAFTGQAAGSGRAAGHNWSSIPDVHPLAEPGLSDSPDIGVNVGDTTIGPRRDYAINFTTTGTYYIWVRMSGDTATSDSLHVGLDGVLRSAGSLGISLNAADLGYFNWVWKNRTSGGVRVTANVTTTGIHTLNLWMREDGAMVDQFILTRDASFVPAGSGAVINESGGRVDFQAEAFTGQAAGTGAAAGHTWSQISDAAAGGGLALQATPNTGIGTGNTTIGPRRDYSINFSNTGTYYVWVRSSGVSGNDDSLHVGLDGVLRSGGSLGLGNVGNWAWDNRLGNGTRVTVVVTTPGVHTFNLWMREDGAKVDQFILTKDVNLVP